MENELQLVSRFVWLHLFESTLWVAGLGIAYWVLPLVKAKHRFLMLQFAMLKFLVPTGVIAALLPRFGEVATPLDTLFVTTVSEATRAIQTDSSATAWMLWIGGTWLAGMGILLIFQFRLWIRSKFSEAKSRESGIEISSWHCESLNHFNCPVEIVDESRFSSIGLCGVFRPRIIISNAFLETLSEEELQLALRHELAHLNRRDNLWRGIHVLTVFVFWFHPFVWMLFSRLRLESEHACDEEVLQNEKEPRKYAKCLLKAASFISGGDRLWATSLTDTSLKKRITKIIAFKNMKESKLKTVVLFTLAIGLIGALTGASSNAFAQQIEADDEAVIGEVYDLKELDREKGDKLPRAMFQKAPVYPADLKKKGVEGWASVEWIIDSKGNVRKPRVIKSSHREFQSPAIEAVIKSKWTPAIKDGLPVNVRVTQRIDFNIGEKVATSRSKP